MKKWIKVREKVELGEVTNAIAEHEVVALSRTNKGLGALCNSCPHQGGPLGDGFIDENGWLICPWHGYEYDPQTGEVPGGYDDIAQPLAVEEREDGIYVELEIIDHKRTLMNQMVDTMIEWGVKTVFGMVGHSNLGLADAFYQAQEKGDLQYIGIRHEGAAAFAASGYAKLTGKPAACFSIAGPGATNLLTGLWDAKVDRVPILALTGQVQTQVLGPGAFQEVPLDKAFESVASWSQVVINPKNATELMGLAIKNAIINRDVGHLIFPDDIQKEKAIEPEITTAKEGRLATEKIVPDDKLLDEAIRMLDTSERPAIIIGNGARPFADLIMKLARKIDAPIITTFKAKGTYDESEPYNCGVLGRSGTPVASATMGNSDVLLVIGASFSNHTGISMKKKIIQIDYDRMLLGKFNPVELPIWGEIGLTINKIYERVNKSSRSERLELVKYHKDRWRDEKRRRAKLLGPKGRLSNARIFAELQEHVPEDSIISVDVGNNTYAFGMYYESKQHALLMSGYLGSIGFSFPAAMGAAVAEPDKKIIAIAGDGGFAQYAMI